LHALAEGVRAGSPPQTCTTSFLAAAQATPGLDFLVQAIQRGNLASVLPAAGSGATVFAPNNAAFTDMLQTLSARASSLLALQGLRVCCADAAATQPRLRPTTPPSLACCRP
jgi:hypothetical protein